MSYHEADVKRMEQAGGELVRQLAAAERQAGRQCDLDDYPVRAEWSYLRSRQTPDRAFQMYIDATFSLTGDENGDCIVSTALVASGRTAVDCLEMFHNWATDAARDPNVIAVFRDKAMRGEQAERDAQKEAAERAEAELAAANVAAFKSKAFGARVGEWLAKMAHAKVRRDGVNEAPIISLPPKGAA